jgi:hypothetical protein
VIPLRRWQPRHLFGSWVAYWIALLAVVFWRPLYQLWRASRGPATHATVGFTYSGSALALALWIAGPPLLLFLLWVATRPRDRAPFPERDRVR